MERGHRDRRAREGTAVGTLTSEVYDQFKIVSVQPTDPNVRVVFKPIAKDLLKRAGIRGGYEFTATVGKGIQLGPWRSLLRIFTTLKEANPIEVELTARRSGPVLFLPAIPINGSAHFDTDKLLLNLERFPRQRGSKAAVPAIISSMKDEFRIINVPLDRLSVHQDFPGTRKGNHDRGSARLSIRVRHPAECSSRHAHDEQPAPHHCHHESSESSADRI